MSTNFDIELSAELLAQACNGVSTAQAEIYRRFERAVYSLARRMVKCPDAAYDVTQDAFMTAFKRLHQFRGDGSFGMWLRRVVATEALMHLRKQRRIFEIFTVAEAGEQIGLEDVSTTDLEHLLGLLDDLPRAVLWLYHVEGYTHPEIAKMCGKSVSFSKSQLSRAHQKLRDELSAPSPADPDAGQAAAQEKGHVLFC